MSMKSILLCTLFLGVAFASPAPNIKLGLQSKNQLKSLATNFESLSQRHQIETINEFMDMVIEEFRNFMLDYGLDPLRLPDMQQNIAVPSGTFNMTDGWAKELTSLYRDGDVVITYDENRVFTANMTLFFKMFTLDFRYDVDVSGIQLGGNVHGKVIYVPVACSLQIEFEKLFITLNSFEIPEIGNVKVDFEGGMMDWLLKLLSGIVEGVFKDLIGVYAPQEIRKGLENIIEVINEILGTIVS